MRKCKGCGKSLEAERPNKRWCAPSCRNKVVSRLSKKPSTKHLAAGTVGAVSELVAAADLLRRGYAALRALSPSAPFDLVAKHPHEDRLLRFEVRTGYWYVGATADGKRTGTRTLAYSKHTGGEIDHFIVVVWQDTNYEVIYEPPLP